MLVLHEKNVALKRKGRKGVYTLESTPNTKELEKILGFDHVQPIHLTASDEKDTMEKEKVLREWYEYELKKFFEESR
jgi:hypothetical protein